MNLLFCIRKILYLISSGETSWQKLLGLFQYFVLPFLFVTSSWASSYVISWHYHRRWVARHPDGVRKGYCAALTLQRGVHCSTTWNGKPHFILVWCTSFSLYLSLTLNREWANISSPAHYTSSTTTERNALQELFTATDQYGWLEMWSKITIIAKISLWEIDYVFKDGSTM